MRRPNATRSISLRARIILLVLAVALLPLGLVGWWLTRTAARSGEELLRVRLDEALEGTIAEIGPRWVSQRSALLAIAESESVQRALVTGSNVATEVPAEIRRLTDALPAAIATLVVQDEAGRVVWSIDRASTPAAAGESLGEGLLPVRVDVFERAFGRRVGALETRVDVASLLGSRISTPFVGGAVLAVLDDRGTSLVSTPFDPTNLAKPEFHWAGEAWLTERRALTEPRLELVAAAPLDPFTAPFDGAARRGLWVLFGAAVAALAVAAAITARMTRRLDRLVGVAEAVARGDLASRTEVTGADEVGRLAHAFNAMTESLGRTLGELSQRESLAAVGAFASELAHEVRNPLTAIRVDLQVVEEQLPTGSLLRDIQRGALEEIERLDGTVSGVLQVARSGKIELRPVDLGSVLDAATRAAQPELERQRATLDRQIVDRSITVLGDPGALRQLVLNLLLNAAQALGAGGRVELRTAVEAHHVTISVKDDGVGMTRDVLAKVREPFFSTRDGGTGLGLAIADRVARAHGGPLEIESTPGSGTEVRVRISRA